MRPEEARARLAALGFGPDDVETLFDHFDDAERRGKLGHGHARIEWLETQSFDPRARPRKEAAHPAFDYWEARGALGYLVLAEICAELADAEPWPVRVVASDAFPSGHLGYWVRWLADAGLVALLTASSPARLAHPDGSEPLVGTNPLAIGLPNPEGDPVIVDVSMAKATYGDVIAGRARPEDVVPFGEEQAHKAFALALGLEGFIQSFVGPSHGIVLVAAKPEFDHFAADLRERAAGLRLPGDS
ncbi:MAG: Ldh family oxidoreductase [Actinobacteria bacterium]|nr:Ldh family oxidoreductase [Actinomycetota bacterium]